MIDIRLRRLQPIAVPTLPWVIAFLLWAIIGTAVVAPEHLIERGVEMAILFALYGTIAHGVQKVPDVPDRRGHARRDVHVHHGGLLPPGPLRAAMRRRRGAEGAVYGVPDGRPCETSETCRGPEAEPGLEYRCEHVGLFGTYSVEERVRYRGELQDPNEVALTISAGALSLLIAFALRRRNALEHRRVRRGRRRSSCSPCCRRNRAAA